jgi:NADH-quinone oxidoreductase subunit L
VAFAVALLVAGMTAFYMTRLCVRVFLGPEKAHAHEGNAGMVAPMAALAVITLGIGFFSREFAALLSEVKGWPDLGMATAGTLVALSGIAVGVWIFGMKKVDTEAVKARFPRTYRAFMNKFYFDLFYDRVFVRGFVALAGWLSRFDASTVDGVVNGAASMWSRTSRVAWKFDASVIDGAVNGVGSLVARAGARLRGLQAGEVQGYQRLAYASLLTLPAASVLTPVIGPVYAFAGGAVVLLLMGVVALRGA